MFNSVHSLVIRHLVIPSLPSHHSPFTIPGHHIHRSPSKRKKEENGTGLLFTFRFKGTGSQEEFKLIDKNG